MSGIDRESSIAWCIAVFASNEEETIAECIRCIDAASNRHGVSIYVMLNGSKDRTIDRILEIRMRHAKIKVLFNSIADKSNAINAFIYKYREPCQTIFMIDAYVKVQPEALACLQRALDADPTITIASAVPRNGFSAEAYTKELIAGGAINGNLYAFRRDFADAIVSRGYRLPLGLYRTDPLLGSMAARDLDATRNPWNTRRLAGIQEAGYVKKALSPLRWRDIQRQFRREIAQSRGVIENCAIKEIIYASGYGALPRSADDMVRSWLARHSLPRLDARRSFFLRLAVRQLAQRQRLDDPLTEDFETLIEKEPLSALTS
jgi:glycosyltransferase involved in cell wall biosynthesis